MSLFVAVKRVEQRHAAPLAGLLGDSRSLPRGLPLPGKGESVEAWVWRNAARRAAPSEYVFVVAIAPEVTVGTCALSHVSDGSADLGYWIATPYRNRGYATAAAQTVLSYGFESLRLREIVTCVAPDNLASLRVLEKLGLLRDLPAHSDAAACLQPIVLRVGADYTTSACRL